MMTASATPVLRVPATPRPPRLLDVLQQAAAERGHSAENPCLLIRPIQIEAATIDRPRNETIE
jgi:hypothetical protein